MDRSREAKRASMAIANGSARRRQRSSSLRDSPEEDGAVELQEAARLRDRVSGRKDRDRDHRERERDRDRDRDRASRSKRRRRERLMQGSHREDGGEESSEESVDDDEDEEDDDGGGGGPLRMFPPNPLSSLSAMPNHPHRKSFTPAGKHFCSPATCKTADEMIGVSVPRKARTASTKRSHDYLMTSANGSGGVVGVGGEQFHGHASASPVRNGLIAAVSSPAPSSPPSSFNPSARKKTKPNGPKQRAPKTASKPPSSNPDEIEFEIAEVLFGLRQNQGPPKQEGDESPKIDSREMNKSCGDVKSRVSSPIYIHSSQPLIPLQTSLPASPFSATAPKRKKPRPVRCEEEHSGGLSTRDSPISCTIKAEIDPLPKADITTTNSDIDSGSALENGVHGMTLSQSTPSEPPRELLRHEVAKLPETKPPIEVAETKKSIMATEEAPCPRNGSPALKSDDCLDAATTAQIAAENHREEKFQIDLMAPPPQLRSSPERESEFNFGSADSKAAVPIIKTEDGEGKDNGNKFGEADGTKAMKIVVEEADPPKPAAIKDRNVDLQLGMVKCEVDNTPLHHVPKQSKPSSDLPSADKNAQSSSSSSLQLSVPSWLGAVSPMGLMRPLQGVASMDGSPNTVPSMPIQLFSQPRPKRCATHCYIAQNICHQQQYARMNPFWPSASTAPSLYGKPCNNNATTTTEMQASVPVKNPSMLRDIKAPSLATFISQGGKDKVSQASNVVDKVSRQQILLPPNFTAGAPNSILHAPAFIVPFHQQQAASARPGAGKSPTFPGSAASVVDSSLATTMSFSFPSMPANEAAPYVAILQNGGYQFPIPGPVAAPPPSFFNNPFYSAPMLHPSLLSQQQQQQPPSAQLQQQHHPPSAQLQQQHHHSKTISSGSSTSQKNLQSQQQQQQQRAHSSGISSGSGSFPAPKNRQLQPVQQLQQHSHHITSLHQARQHEREMGGEGSPSTADSQVSRGSITVYGQSFAMPNLPSAMPSGSSIDEKVQHKHAHQQQGLKAGAEPLASQAMAMTLASISGAGTAASCFDISSMAQNHAILPGLMEPVRHNFQIMAAAAQPKREGKTGVGNDERKSTAEKCSAVLGQAASSVTAIQGNNVNTGSVSSWPTCAIMPAAISTVTASNSQLQQRHQHQQLQQMLQIQKQQQQPYAAVRSKTPAASNGTVYPEHSSSSMAVKFSNVLTPFPPNSSSPSQSPQWKSAPRANISQVGYPALMPSSSTSSMKNVRGHQQISFAANTKSSTQQAPGSSQSPPLMVGSPTTSSISKSGGGGSPMMATASSSMGSKPGQASSALSSQGKNGHKPSSSGGGGRNASSIHAHIPAPSSTGAKILHQQQAIPQQVSKQAMQQGQLFFSQVQVPHYLNAGPTPAAANRYHQAQRRRPEQQQQLQGSLSMPSTVASFCPVMRAATNTNTSDAAKAAASGDGNVKGVVPPGFHYIQTVPPVVQLNQAEQKQPAGE